MIDIEDLNETPGTGDGDGDGDGGGGGGDGLFATGRMEAFSDGVFAIAITLLVLDLAVPDPDELAGRSLAGALGHDWPAYLAYLVSFVVIGVIWINHHAMCRLARRVNRVVLFANLGLLLVVSLIPFPTRLLATYLLDEDGNSHTAAAVYSATMLCLGIAFSGLYLSLTRDVALLHHPLPPAIVRATLRRFGIGTVLYSATIAISFVNAVAALVAHLVIGLYYCFDQLAPSTRRTGAPPAD